LHFNYRVIQAEYEDEPYFEIRTIYYNNAGEICLISKEATVPIGDSIEELQKVFNYYLKAFEKPVLVEKEIKFGSCDGIDGPFTDIKDSDFDDSESSDDIDFLFNPLTQ